MILDCHGNPVTVAPAPKQKCEPPAPKPKMHKCLWCGRRSRLGTYCCNARYREDSKFNAETKHQRLDRLAREEERKRVKALVEALL
jgi:hypothetical protein